MLKKPRKSKDCCILPEDELQDELRDELQDELRENLSDNINVVFGKKDYTVTSVTLDKNGGASPTIHVEFILDGKECIWHFKVEDWMDHLLYGDSLK